MIECVIADTFDTVFEHDLIQRCGLPPGRVQVAVISALVRAIVESHSRITGRENNLLEPGHILKCKRIVYPGSIDGYRDGQIFDRTSLERVSVSERNERVRKNEIFYGAVLKSTVSDAGDALFDDNCLDAGNRVPGSGLLAVR